MTQKFASDYVDVAARIAEFRAKYPDGTLQPADPAVPYRVEEIGGKQRIVVVAAAYRTPDDPRPGIGMAYEEVPGKTPYTRDSELQNAETSAWGRAIVAALAADTKKGIASAEEVRNRQADRAPTPQDFHAKRDGEPDMNDTERWLLAWHNRAAQAVTLAELRSLAERLAEAKKGGHLSDAQVVEADDYGRSRWAALEAQGVTA